MLRLLTAAVILYSYFEVKTGLPRLTGLLPTNHNPSGQPVGTVLCSSLWINLFLQVFISGLFLAVPYIGRRYPEAVHLGWRRLSDYTPEQRERIMPLLKRMMELASLLTSLVFALCNHLLIQSAVSAGPRLPADWSRHIVGSASLSMAGLAVGLAVLTVYYLGRFNKAAREQ